MYENNNLPAWVPSPWELITDELEARGMGFGDLPLEIQRDCSISKREAEILSSFFGNLSAEMWVKAQTQYDRWRIVKMMQGESPAAIEAEMSLPFFLPEGCIGFEALDERHYTLFFEEVNDGVRDLVIDLEWSLRDSTGEGWYLTAEDRGSG